MFIRNTFSTAFLLLLLLIGGSFHLWAQSRPNLYIFLVIQQDAGDVGSLDDGENMSALMDDVKELVPGINLIVKELSGEEATKERIQSELASISNCANDVIWYYYSGHGRNNDTYPESEAEVPLTWVYSSLKQKGARLTISMYDCCTYQEPTAQPPADIHPRTAGWKPMLLTSKGDYLSSACSSREFSYGRAGAGGIYTNNFIDAFREGAGWEATFDKAKQGTIADKPTQHPVWASQNTGVLQSVMAPSHKVREGETWEDIVKEMNKSLEFNKQSLRVTVEKLKAYSKNQPYKDFAKPPVGAKIYFGE